MSAAAVILLVALPGAPFATEFAVTLPTIDPCVEGLVLKANNSCVLHDDGGIFDVVVNGLACYSGRFLEPTGRHGWGDSYCWPAADDDRVVLDELCVDGSAGAKRDQWDQWPDCDSEQFGFSVERVAGTSNWRVSKIRRIRNVDWDGRAIRVEGTCHVTPGISSAGACLRLQIFPPHGACIIRDKHHFRHDVRLVCSRTDATLLKNGKVHINGPTECPIFQQDGLTALGLASTRYVVCRAAGRQ